MIVIYTRKKVKKDCVYQTLPKNFDAIYNVYFLFDKMNINICIFSIQQSGVGGTITGSSNLLTG